MAIVDASALVAFLDSDDPLHQEASNRVQAEQRLLLPAPALAELLQVVYYAVRQKSGTRAAHQASRRARRELVGLRSVELLFSYDEDLAGIIFEQEPRLSYVDAVGVAAALQSGEELFSFDRDQLAVWRARRRKP